MSRRRLLPDLGLFVENWNKPACLDTRCMLNYVHRVPKKTKQICFCQNFVKFAPILIIFGRKMGNDPNICEVHLFSTSPNLRYHFTVLNANVPKGGSKRKFVVLANKTQTRFYRINSATKFVCVKTPSDKVVAESFPNLTV